MTRNLVLEESSIQTIFLNSTMMKIFIFIFFDTVCLANENGDRHYGFEDNFKRRHSLYESDDSIELQNL